MEQASRDVPYGTIPPSLCREINTGRLAHARRAAFKGLLRIRATVKCVRGETKASAYHGMFFSRVVSYQGLRPNCESLGVPKGGSATGEEM